MNIWKWLFIGLLVINAVVLTGLFIFLSGDYDSLESFDAPEGEQAEHVITLENHTVEFLLNSFLQDGADDITVSIDEENIQLMAENEYLNMNFDTIFNLEPYITETELIFEVSNISIGRLPLSGDMAYTLIRTGADLPEGMAFSTDSRALVIDKTLFDEFTDLSVDVEEIDYQNNAWYFSFED